MLGWPGVIVGIPRREEDRHALPRAREEEDSVRVHERYFWFSGDFTFAPSIPTEVVMAPARITRREGRRPKRYTAPIELESLHLELGRSVLEVVAGPGVIPASQGTS